jgi:hypothetical protein
MCTTLTKIVTPPPPPSNLDFTPFDASTLRWPVCSTQSYADQKKPHTWTTLTKACDPPPPPSNLDFTPFDASTLRWLPSILYVAYIVFNTIVLLNLLIAIMSDR